MCPQASYRCDGALREVVKDTARSESAVVHLTAYSHPMERRSWGREIPAWRFQPAVLRAENSSKALERALRPKAAADSGSWTAAGACRNGEARGM